MPIYEGMTIRLLAAVCVAHGLTKDSEGIVVRVDVNPLEAEDVKAQVDADPSAQVFLQYLPRGIYVKVPKYSKSVLRQTVNDDGYNHQEREQLGSIIYLEPQQVKFNHNHVEVVRSGCRSVSDLAARG